MGPWVLINARWYKLHSRMRRQDYPTTTDLDIFRAANELIEQHGEDAPIRAAMRTESKWNT